MEGHGVPVKLANPLKTRAIAEARTKTDRLTARIPAHLLGMPWLRKCVILHKCLLKLWSRTQFIST